ncbi:hypothetical protein ES703_27686 [subsurface metagenome]
MNFALGFITGAVGMFIAAFLVIRNLHKFYRKLIIKEGKRRLKCQK